jgi:hypothetical protein
MASGAEEGRSEPCVAGLSQDVQHQLNEGQKLFGVSMQKSIIPDTPETFG